MELYELQQKVYENKLKRKFNVTDVGKEINLMSEELGELCAAHITKDSREFIDAIGDIMVYCLGLCAMFEWNADNVINAKVEYAEKPFNKLEYIPYIGRELGFFSKTLKKSNKKTVQEIDLKGDFRKHLGNLMGYCMDLFDHCRVDGKTVLEQIVIANEKRTHEGQM